MRKSENGFTLVELAIVLMIIGLLIGGVLRGQELLNNARIAKTVEQVKSYQGAIATFRDIYAQYPGDMGNAQNRIPGCTALNYCLNGNGNQVIGNANVSLGTLQTGAAAPGVETTQFWKHLALAHIITGVKPSSDPATPSWGSTHPGAPFNGGFMVNHGSHVNNNGIWLVLSTNIVGTTAYNFNGGNPVNPVQAQQIDRKMDDGMPDQGDVQAPDDGTCDNNIGPQGQRLYLPSEYNTCVLVFNIF